MVYALIKNNIIENVIVACEYDRGTYENEGYEFVEIPEEPGSPGIGWRRVNGVFIQPEAEN